MFIIQHISTSAQHQQQITVTINVDITPPSPPNTPSIFKMQLKNIMVAVAALASSAPTMAAPTGKSGVVVDHWIFRGTKLACDAAGNNCTWTLKIDQKNGKAPVACAFSQPSLHQDTAQTRCRGSDYFVSIGWSGSFWTMAVVDPTRTFIAYPSYNTGDIHPGATAADKEFNVEKLPK